MLFAIVRFSRKFCGEIFSTKSVHHCICRLVIIVEISLFTWHPRGFLKAYNFPPNPSSVVKVTVIDLAPQTRVTAMGFQILLSSIYLLACIKYYCQLCIYWHASNTFKSERLCTEQVKPDNVSVKCRPHAMSLSELLL